MKTKLPLVSIIVVNYNGRAVLPDCLASIKKIDYPNWELILVDNGSTDDSLKQINKIWPKKLKKNLLIIKNTENLGFAPANNVGYQKSNGEYILLLNNDTKVTPDFLTKMVNRMKREKEIGAMQPKIHLMDRPAFLDNSGSFLNTIGFSNHWGFGQKDSKEFDKEREVFAAKGACLLTRREVIEKTGLFDDDFRSYFEESDFCWRVWMAGWKVIYYPKASIFHKLGFTSSKQSAVEINFHSLKNRIVSFIKNFELGNVIKFLGVHIVFLIALSFIYLSKLQFSKVNMITKAIWWNIINLRSTLRKRKEIQKMRSISDKQLLPTIMQKTDFGHMFAHFRQVESNFKK